MPKTLTKRRISQSNLAEFRQTVWGFYKEHSRTHLPWRDTRDPYKILVSEIMLQQTQVDRVLSKYQSFLKKFPTIKSLSAASLQAVLIEWQGLGYNRRALNLKRTAEEIVNKHGGKFPTTYSELVELPGIGKATAGDLLAFAWNKPSVVIETNIRTVFIHHFFKNRKNISDAEIATLIEKTLPKQNVRDWYYALMDYGSYLKQTRGNNIRLSKHYKKQSPFKGSRRQKNAAQLRKMLAHNAHEEKILKLLAHPHVSTTMPTKYGPKTKRKMKKVMHEYKTGKLKSGRSNKKVKSRKQAIAIGLSEARKSGARVPRKRKGKR